jgi:hypothetical protein
MIKITDVKSQNKKALYMILHIYDLREQYRNAMTNMSYIGAANLDGMPHGTGVGDPAQAKAMKLIEIESKKNWIMSIEQMESTLSDKHLAFLQYRRDAEYQIESVDKNKQGRPGWVDYVSVKYNDWFYEQYGHEISVSMDTLKAWQSKIVDTTVRIAIYHGCFSI